MFRNWKFRTKDMIQVLLLFLYVVTGIQAQKDAFPVTCGEPPPVERATPSSTEKEHDVGTVVTYSCDLGFVVHGTRRVSECLTQETGGGTVAFWSEPNFSCIPRSCGDPGFVQNARRVGSVFTFPSRVQYECAEGYILRGIGSRYCQASGTWSGRLPVCETLKCNSPISPQNGRAVYSSIEYGSELEYECDRGFILQKKQIRICTAEGVWSGEDPVCIEATCEPLSNPKHGTVVADQKPKEGSIAIFTCNGDRELIGSSTSKCLSIGEWTFPTPKCVASCAIPVVQNGYFGIYEQRSGSRHQPRFVQKFSGDKMKNNQEVVLKCFSGYVIENSSKKLEASIICRDGEWSEIPVCELAQCGQPPPLENASIMRFQQTHGGTISYHCNPPFKKTKSGNMTCNLGDWVGVQPTCSDTRCYTEKINYLGLRISDRKVFNSGETMMVECEEGYELANPLRNEFNCINGEWNVRFSPCIEARCYTEKMNYPGLKISNKKVFNSRETMTVECGEGYELADLRKKKLKCEKGEWKGHFPPCIEAGCSTAVLNYPGLKLNGGQIMVKSGQKISFSCDEGYKLTSSTQNQLTCEYGQWTGQSPPCVEAGCSTAVLNYPGLKLKGGKIMVKSGQKISFSCDEGYKLTSSSQNQLTCEYGQWTGQLPPCVEDRSAEAEDSRKNSSLQPPSTVVSSEKIFPAEDHPENSQDARDCFCIYNNLKPNVIAITENEKLLYGSKVRNGTIIKFDCLRFHTLNGTSELICNCLSWDSIRYPSCKMESGYCYTDYLNYPGFQKSTKTLFFPNEGFTPVCAKGYKTATPGRNRLVCENNEWKGELPPCIEEKFCDPPTKPEHGSVTPSNTKLKQGSIAVYSCDEDRVLVGPSSTMCNHTGKWTNPPPNCVGRCIVPPVVNGLIGVRKSSSFIPKSRGEKIGSDEEAVLLCTKGYAAAASKKSDAAITCNDGKWVEDISCLEEKLCGEQPPLKNAIITSTSKKHGESVTYQCVSPFRKTKQGNMTCHFGNWEGIQPICTDTRCHIDDLKYDGLVKGWKMVYNSTEKFTPSCQEGYSLSNTYENEIKCQDGKWKGHFPPCVENSCNHEPRSVPYGRAKVDRNDGKQIVTYECNEYYVLKGYSTVQCIRGQWIGEQPICKDTRCYLNDLEETSGLKLSVSNHITYSGADLQVQCNPGYIYHGLIPRCSEGEWNVKLVPCKKQNSFGNEEYVAGNSDSETHPTTPSVFNLLKTSTSAPAVTQGQHGNPQVHEASSQNPNDCFCTYDSQDTYVVAYADGEVLQYGSRVKTGTTVKFQCKLFGYHRLTRLSEITCLRDKWSTNTYPLCVNPSSGDAYISFNTTIPVLLGRTLGIKEYASVSISCLSDAGYPNWKVPSEEGISTLTNYDIFEQRYRYYTILYIENANIKNEGRYECGVPGYRSMSFWIKIQMPECSLDSISNFLPQHVVPDVTNVAGVKVPFGSSVVLTCNGKNMHLVGSPRATCGQSGIWEYEDIQCIYGCRPVRSATSVQLIMKPEQGFYAFGDTVQLYCPDGYVLSKEVHVMMCLENGWSEEVIPECLTAT